MLPKTRKPHPKDFIVMDSPKNKKIETDFMLELDLLTARESDFGFELLLVPERKRRDSSSLVQVAFWEHALKEASCMRVLKGRWPSNKLLDKSRCKPEESMFCHDQSSLR